MQIPNIVDPQTGREVCIAPPEYERFTLRRLFWELMGKDYDALSRREVDEALTFLDLERRHPQRAERAAREWQRRAQVS